MTHLSLLTKRIIAWGLASLLMFSLSMSVFFFVVPTAYAEDLEPLVAGELAAGSAEGGCVTGGGAVCPPKGIRQSLQIIGDKIVGPAFRVALMQMLLNLSQFVLDRLAYEAAVAIASGGVGEGSLFYEQTPSDAFAQLGLEVAGEAVGSLVELNADQLGIQFDLCDPGAALQLALAIGIKQQYQPTAPKCDILEVIDNWQSFTSNLTETITDPDARREAILEKFAESLKPGRNELSASLRLNIAIDNKVHEAKWTQFFERVEGEYKPVQQFITGTVQTPADTLQDRFETDLKNPVEQRKDTALAMMGAGEMIGGLAVSTASTFTNTLLSQTIAKIYSGLFDTELPPDPFDVEGLGNSGKDSAEERFSSIIAPSPIINQEYNILSEFVVCPVGGGINRGLYNCVFDANFMAAVSRGSGASGEVALTVQEAIDEGLLNGDWPLIPPSDEASNQDPFCYTYGYCYGNLVKLRNARVIPVGWELAALRNTTTERATLQEIIDGFDDCTEDGAIGPNDSDSKWCHLIDPNWVLKYPQTQCRSIANGQIRISQLAPGRNSVCVDAPSCIGTDNDGNCTDGYGYCVQEENVWRFRGDECEEEYATCLAVSNTETGDEASYLVNTVEYGVCGQDNAGCYWYRTNKYFDDQGNEDEDDDGYEWLPGGETYTTADRDDDWRYVDTSASPDVTIARADYSYDSGTGETREYSTYAFEDRAYFTHDAEECDEEGVGCTQLYEFADDLYLNAVINPSFETDEDEDGVPDGWITLLSSYALDTNASDTGSVSLAATPSSLVTQLMQYVPVAENSFYTFSFSAMVDRDGDAARVTLTMLDEDGNELDASGTSSLGDCSWDSANLYYEIDAEASSSDFDQFTCTFTTIEDVATVRIRLGAHSLSASSTVYLDSVQLEVGEDANTFTEGYSKAQTVAYYKVAPSYLGCTGDATDPSECDTYAQMCDAQDVGCNLYAPEDGDPSVPAIVSELDECPSECVGYTTYKQEATDFESEDFPLYFIADSATACSETYVGCDAYTNLGETGEGGEDVEYYTDIRSCLSEDIADGSDADKTPATFFTWEGSDNEGYQLKTWYLLESNYAASKDAFDSGTYTETDPGLAPCTTISMSSENEVVCDDTLANMNDTVWSNTDCDEYDDIFENPDCREFYDSEGNVHYREYSDTISIDAACTPYRKDDSNETDCGESGGYWTDQGFCRYYLLAAESEECPEEQSGCRSYTGGAGRNATTVLNDTFETGTYDNWAIHAPEGTSSRVTLSISNESVAANGQSLLMSLASGEPGGAQTIHIYANADGETAYDADDSSTCSSYGDVTATETEAGCEVEEDIDGDGTADESCTITDGSVACGTLVNALVEGKTFVLDFWAKGSSNLYVSMAADGGSGTTYDLVDPGTEIAESYDGEAIELSGSWELYSIGPFDTSDLSDFDAHTILQFTTEEDESAYIDNITLKQVEENITIIKDSWVVPSTCDQTPDGAESDQYYLGCEAYTDQNGNDANLYQFTQLCEEEVVGCEGFYHTGNSESAYQQIFNARCAYSTDTDFGDAEAIGASTACVIDGIEYCTIAAGQSYCNFDVEQVFEDPLPYEEVDTSNYFAIVYGPETRIVEGDTPVYLVADDFYECDEVEMGCQEFGEPSFNQDQTQVESFDSVYLIDLPADYSNILCDHEALFCEEWETTQDGNLYFKDPHDKTCEFKTSVTLNNQAYQGWFKTDTSEPCYWTDVDGDEAFDVLLDDAYLISGTTFGVWRNGDDNYDQWIATCDDKYDLCTEFIDTVDTEAGREGDGTSYYFVNNELLSDEQLLDTQRCNGTISQKFGCALFNNTTDSELLYNTAASYVTSVHADVFYGDEPNVLVDPVSCTDPDDGYFEITEADAEIHNVTDNDTGDYVTEVNLCKRRCEYRLGSAGGGELTTAGAAQYSSSPNRWFERSCFTDTDCPVLVTSNGEEVSGSCVTVDENVQYLRSSEVENYYLTDDANEIMKVNRDRECSAWLACRASQPTWNEQTGRYENICQDVDLCVEASATSTGSSTCTEFTPRDPIILSDRSYSERNVNWDGVDYSGMSIPYQLPVEHYDQFEITPTKGCYTAYGTAEIENDNGYHQACSTGADCGTTSNSCSTDSDCGVYGLSDGVCDGGVCTYNCSEIEEEEYRLVYNAGTCDADEDSGVGRGGDCYIGYCESTGGACSSSDDCGTAESCITGYCQSFGENGCSASDLDDDGNCQCSTDDDCSGITDGSGESTPYCDTTQNKCAIAILDDEEKRTGCSATSSFSCASVSGAASCVQTSDIYTGGCFNDRCLTDIRDKDFDAYNTPDPLDVDDAAEMECRGYPEVDSPHGPEVVYEWKTYDAEDDPGNKPNSSTSNLEIWSEPYTYVGGYNDANVCSVDEDGNITECDCSYDRVEYGNGSDVRYVQLDASYGQDQVPEAICVGGGLAGVPCSSDNDCDPDGSPGSCQTVTRQDTLYGWYGYCIEYDSSIQLNASNDDEDRACLSWIPVDQLEGATNLYAKFEEAGFELENHYFCAEPQEVYAVGRSNIGCAETGSSCPNKEWSDFVEHLDDDPKGECVGALTCPNNFIAVFTGCAEHGYTKSGEADETNSWCGKDNFSVDDSDCPFFCIPDQTESVNGVDIDLYRDVNGDGMITEDDYDEDGELEACKSPANLWTTWNYDGNAGEAYTLLNFNIKARLLRPSSWYEAFEYYEDCYVTGLSEDDVIDMYQPFDGPWDVDLSYYESNDHPSVYSDPNAIGQSFGFNTKVQASCDTIVQVSTESLVQGNKAFTNRLWEDHSPRYDVDDFGYDYDVGPQYYGLTITMDDIDTPLLAHPVRAATCEEDNNAPADGGGTGGDTDHLKGYKLKAHQVTSGGSCDSGSLTAYDAQLYRDIILGIPEDDLTARELGDGGGGYGFPYSIDEYAVYQKECSWADDETACGISTLYCSSDSECNSQIECDSGSGTCEGGPNDGLTCSGHSECRVLECFQGDEFISGVIIPFAECGIPADYVVYRLDTVEEAVSRMGGLFAESYSLEQFQGYGSTEYYKSASIGEWSWDITDGSGDYSPVPPTIKSVGKCFGSECLEGVEGRITVNNVDASDLTGAGTMNATSSFYMYANQEQMPIRTVIMDWGDGDEFSSESDWPTDGQYGSSANDNRYKNHRGLTGTGSSQTDICGRDRPSHFGVSDDGCSQSYVSFNNDYVCSTSFLASMQSTGTGRLCEIDDETGNLINSPCYGGDVPGATTDDCVFQPRVFVQDNWGWCASSNETCDAGSDYSEAYCYGGNAGSDDPGYADECDYQNCPGDDCDISPAETVDPWVYFDGFVIVESE